MKGILLAAGSGGRLQPLTCVVNKVALPVYNQPMFYYALKTILDSGIDEMVVVVDPKFGDQIKTLAGLYPGKISAKIRFCVQRKPGGLVDAVRSAQALVGSSDIFVCAGDNVIDGDFSDAIKTFNSGAVAFLKKVSDPERFGTPRYSDKGKLLEILEKPPRPQTKYAVTAPYIFDKGVFELIKTLRPSKRGELEITDLLNLYLREEKLKLLELKGAYFDTGTFQSLLAASTYVHKNKEKFFP